MLVRSANKWMDSNFSELLRLSAGPYVLQSCWGCGNSSSAVNRHGCCQPQLLKAKAGAWQTLEALRFSHQHRVQELSLVD